MDRLQAMQAFVRVVECGSFTKAADRMDLPKANVTRLVQTLETHLRTKLLNRTTRRVTVTPDGTAYFERAAQLLSDLDEMEGTMTQARAVPRGRIRADVPAELGRMMVVPALPDFFARYPEIQIDLGVSDRNVDLLTEQVDCVVRGGEISDQSLIARRVGEFHYSLCASPQYLARHGTPRHPADLESDAHRVVSYFRASIRDDPPVSRSAAAARRSMSLDATACRSTTVMRGFKRGSPAWASSVHHTS